MQDVFLLYLACFLISIFVSFVCTALYMAWFRRRCTQLEWAIGELQTKASSFRGKELAEKRWSKEKAFDAELAQHLQAAPVTRRKYDNDPLGSE
jgi:hypothetical protein